MKKVRKSKRMSKAEQKKYIERVTRKHGRVQLVFGFINDDEVCHDLYRILYKSGKSRYKFGGDASYDPSCFVCEYIYDYNKEKIDWSRLNLRRTIKEMYAYDGSEHMLLEVRVGRTFKKVLKKFT